MSGAPKHLAKTSRRTFASFALPRNSKSPTQRHVASAFTQSSSRLLSRPPFLTSRIPYTLRTMASDSDYMAFLDKANRQRDAGRSQLGSESLSQQLHTETVETGVEVPRVLKTVNAFYISETDQPFEPVALRWAGASKGKWPGNDEFASLITGSRSTASNISSSIQTFSEQSFDPHNQYSSVFKAVRAAAVASDPSVDAGSIDVKIYRVEVGHSRIEYWIVALEAAEGKIVGLRAKAIES